MQITVSKIFPNSGDSDFNCLEANVSFYDETTDPHFSADVVVFLEKKDLPLSQIEALAIQKARDFLSHI
ncbi:MAG: hypothetical protein HZB36_01085 [Candidatus Omnitrophica bacterium]|nr:hypothetical protein [Candidatus Omnitrophota bacterium]